MEFRMCSINVNSLIEYKRKFMLSEFMRTNQAHVYLVQETKFGIGFRYAHGSFNTFTANNRIGCGGVMVLVHNGIRTRNVRTIVGEIDALLLDVETGNGWVTVGSVYAHPAVADFAELVKFFPNNSPMVLGGDWNARHSLYGDSSNNRLGVALAQLAIDANLIVHTPDDPTCFRIREGSFLDKFVNNIKCDFSMSRVSSLPSFSDHCGIIMTLHLGAFALNVRNGFTLKQYGRANIVGLNRFIEQRLRDLMMPTDSNLEDGDLEFIAGEISNTFGESITKFVPEKFVRTNGILLSDTAQALLHRSHSLQRKLWRGRRAGLSLPELTAVRTELTLVRQMSHNAISNELCRHYNRILAETAKMGDMHRTIVTNTGHRRRAKCPATLYTDENKNSNVSGGEAIADEFAKRFGVNHQLTTIGDASCGRRLLRSHLYSE